MLKGTKINSNNTKAKAYKKGINNKHPQVVKDALKDLKKRNGVAYLFNMDQLSDVLLALEYSTPAVRVIKTMLTGIPEYKDDQVTIKFVDKYRWEVRRI